jgi:hypothetical protein
MILRDSVAACLQWLGVRILPGVGSLSLVIVVCYQVEVCMSGRDSVAAFLQWLGVRILRGVRSLSLVTVISRSLYVGLTTRRKESYRL